jgi:hypothetical protein
MVYVYVYVCVCVCVCVWLCDSWYTGFSCFTRTYPDFLLARPSPIALFVPLISTSLSPSLNSLHSWNYFFCPSALSRRVIPSGRLRKRARPPVVTNVQSGYHYASSITDRFHQVYRHALIPGPCSIINDGSSQRPSPRGSS